MFGWVYVFNVGRQDLGLAVNGMPICRIPGWLAGTGAGYGLNHNAVRRTDDPAAGAGKFCSGMNQIVVNRDDSVAQFQVTIDGASLPLDEDLLMLLERNQWQLVDASGMVVAGGDIHDLAVPGAQAAAGSAAGA